MGTRYLVDTNTVIYYLDSILPQSASDFLDKSFESEINISVITQIELLSWTPPPGKSIDGVEKFVNSATIINLTSEIAQRAIKVRRTKKN